MRLISTKSSSFHTLNADARLSRPGKALWRVVNWLNNSLPDLHSREVPVRSFAAAVSEDDWRQLDVGSSPSRRLSDLFWLKLPWQLVEEELGEINVVDIGCGSGAYADKLQRYSRSRIASYTGLDVQRCGDWDALTRDRPTVRFRQVTNSSLLPHIPRHANLVISQSAMEHVQEDLLYFQQIAEYIRDNGRTCLQIHVIPSRECRRLYPYHGVRQYVPRTISKIVSLFRDFSHAVLFGLGGEQCNALHWQYICVPLYESQGEDLREVKPREYERELRQAMLADVKTASPEPAHYALTIHSFGRKKFF